MTAESNVDYIEVFMDGERQWRWHAVARNGEIVSEGESHTRAGDAARAATAVFGDKVTVKLQKGN